MEGERAFNMIAGMILAAQVDHATKTELLRWLRLAETRTLNPEPDEGASHG